MGRLIERTVQERAQAYLEQYYEIKYKAKRLFSKLEVRTRKEYGGKRADGFLAYKQNARRAFVISMESKSYKTLPALKPYRADKLWIRESLWWGLLFCLATGSLFVLWRGGEFGLEAWQRWIIPLVTFSAGAAAHAFLMKNSYRFQEMDVIHQVLQYPGNEQWLSFSKDALDDLPEAKQDMLFKICKARGIGVLIAESGKKVTLISKAETQFPLWNDYLIYYSIEDDVRKFLDLPLRKKKTPTKKKRKR